MLTVIKNQTNKNNIYSGPHQQIAFYSCWSPRLNNPLLNKLYKESVCYTERWYLETQSLIRNCAWSHPLLNSIVYDLDLRTDIVKSTVLDGALMRNILKDDSLQEYHISASINLRKSTKWSAFFTSIPTSIKILVDLHDLSLD